MTRMSRVLLAVAVAEFAGPRAWAADALPKVCPAIFVKQAPVVDGKIDATEWRDAEPVGGFSVLGAPETAAAKATTVRVLYTNEALFIAAECREPEMAELQTADKDIWKVDSVEIFVQPKAGGPCWQIVVGANGARGEYLLPEGKFSGASCETQGFRGPDFYSVEAKMPFDLFGARPASGQAWQFNVARDATTPGADRFSSWSELRSSFHEFERFGELLFLGDGEGKAVVHRALFQRRYAVVAARMADYDLYRVLDPEFQARWTAFMEEAGWSTLVRQAAAVASLPADEVEKANAGLDAVLARLRDADVLRKDGLKARLFPAGR